MNELVQGFYLLFGTALLLLYLIVRALIGRAMVNVNGYDTLSYRLAWFITAPIAAASLLFFWLALV